jgi:transposase, IS30 family
MWVEGVVARRGFPAGLVRVVLGYLESGLNPNQAARAAGVSKSYAYKLDREVSGVSRLAARRAARAGRAARPDRRRVPPERMRLLAGRLRAGLNPGQAARAAGVSASTAYRFHKTMGGVHRPRDTQYSDRYLDRDQRYEIARLREQGLSLRAIAGRLGCAASTVSRELARNADRRTGYYLPEQADRMAWQRQRRPKASKLSKSPELCARVQQLLDRRYSPEQVSGRLKVLHPDDPAMRVSHETIYQSIYVYPRGGLRRELTACLRTGRTARRRRGRREMRGKITGAVPIGQRPPEAEGRLVPGHHEGDLVMGSRASNSAVATIVERRTGWLTLIPLPDGHGAGAVAGAVIARLAAFPSWFKTLTWDNGKEMARHQRITGTTGVQVYFADPYSPWQRGSNENTNGLLREYLPKGTDLSRFTPAQLQAIEDELNDRPRKRLGYRTPREELATLLEQDRVATTP